MALKHVKNKIISTKKTGQVTKAMESVSAVKMRKSQERAFAGRPYVHSALRILSRLANTHDGLSHPLAEKRDGERTLLVIVTSDKGLAGSVNSAVLKKADEIFKNCSSCDAVCIGRKAVEFTNRSQKTVLSAYTNVGDDVSLQDVHDIVKIIIDSFTARKYDKVEVVYQNFISTFEQQPTKRQVLPLDPAEIHFTMRGIRPKTGKFSDDVEGPDAHIDYTVEPGVEEVLNTLIPQLTQIMLYHALLESKASEHSARMVAMKNATDKSKEMVKALTIKYNKARQAAITAEVSEITAGVEAMK